MLDHVSYLALHGENEQYNPVTKQYWPKYRNVKYREESHYKRYTERLSNGVPAKTTLKLNPSTGTRADRW